MSMSEESKSSVLEDNELLDHYEGNSASFSVPDYFSEEESKESSRSTYPKWLRTPRSAQDFFSFTSMDSSYKDADYEAWLQKYYDDRRKEIAGAFFTDKCVNTDFEEETVPYSPLFPDVKRDAWTVQTKYWGPSGSRRHQIFQIKRNLFCLVPTIHPTLNLRSRYGRYVSQLMTSAAEPQDAFNLITSFLWKKHIHFLLINKPNMRKMVLCDRTNRGKYLDALTRSFTVKWFCGFMKDQYSLEKVYMENLYYRRLIGIMFLCAIGRNAGANLKELHIWRMFALQENPAILSEIDHNGNFVEGDPTLNYFTEIHFIQILNHFQALTKLSVNYAYLANKRGNALLTLKCVKNGTLKELRLLCLKGEMPFLTNPGYGTGGWVINDGVWARAVRWCPELKVKLVFVNLPKYEHVIVFLSKSIPLDYCYISSGIDLKFEQPWDIDSTLFTLRDWYSETLETLSLHLWRTRDYIDTAIRNLLKDFPNLVVFEFIGILHDIETLEKFCCQISTGNFKIKNVIFWIQEQYNSEKKLKHTRKRLREIREKYLRRFQVIEVNVDLQLYPV